MLNLSYCVYLLLIARVKSKREYQKQWMKKWRTNNPGVAATGTKKWRERNPEKYKEGYLQYYGEHSKEQRARSKAYREANPEWRRKSDIEAKRRRYLRDPLYRAVMSMRCRVRQALAGINKSAKTLELLGCNSAQLRGHLERLFQPGMSWENYGPVWHVDHIKPCAKFDLNYPAQQRECFHFSNLQPLWALENVKKGDTWPNE